MMHKTQQIEVKKSLLEEIFILRQGTCVSINVGWENDFVPIFYRKIGFFFS